MADPPPPPPAPLPHLKERKWLPTLGVLLVMVFVSLGGFFFVGEPREAIGRPEPLFDDPIPVVQGLTIRPLRTWEVGEPIQISIPGVTLNGVRLGGGAALLDVVAAPGAGDPASIWNVYAADVLAADAEQLRVSSELEPFATDQGIQGVRGSYLGVFPGVASPLEGEVTAVVMPDGLGVIADGWAPEGQLTAHLEDIRAMVATLEGG